MKKINGRQLLNREIKETMWDDPEDKIEFPKVFYFCEGLGRPSFKITIDKFDEDVFIDANGVKWQKIKD